METHLPLAVTRLNCGDKYGGNFTACFFRLLAAKIVAAIDVTANGSRRNGLLVVGLEAQSDGWRLSERFHTDRSTKALSETLFQRHGLSTTIQ